MSAAICFRFLRIGVLAFALVCASAIFAKDFQWNWHEARALTLKDSLQKAAIPKQERQPLLKAILEQLKPDIDDPELAAEGQRQKAALDTGIAMMDLNGDGIPEVIAQGTVECSATGNCPIWIFQKAPTGYKVILKGYGQTFTVRHERVNGYFEIVIGMHSSATEQGLTVYSFRVGRYRDIACYAADWQILEGDEPRELREPRITACR